MKRRNFVQSLLVVPAATAAAQEPAKRPEQQPAAPLNPQPTLQPPPAVPRPQAVPRGAQNVPELKLVEPDATAETVTGFFNPAEFAALNKLAETLMPPLKGNPGAIDAHAPEFLDFLLSRSPAADQTLYRTGLAGLNGAARKHFHKPFAEVDAKQADAIIRPLLVARAWDREEPADPMQRFMVRVHQDLRTATMNSAEWASSGSTTGRGRFNGGRRFYWKPIDPRVGA